MRLRWEPAIYEHKAALIGRRPAEVAVSADLLARAMVAEYEAYRSDLMTVGIDIYNIEAEALGAEVSEVSGELCPEIQSPPWRMEQLPELRLPEIPTAGRFAMIAEAAVMARQRIGDRATLRVGVSGPVSLAAKLVGCEDLILSAATGEESAGALLSFALEVAIRWSTHLRGLGLDVIVFDSFASPPNFSPRLYRDVVLPMHVRLMRAIAEAGQADRALVLGGDTTSIVADLCRSGATTLLCDYAADAKAFAAAMPDGCAMTVRRNIAPQALDAPAGFEATAERFVADLGPFARPIAGTGILPYGFRPEQLVRFRECVDARWAAAGL